MNEVIIAKDRIAVTHTIRTDVNREFLTIDVPNGWEDVKQLTKKVLIFDNREFVFSGWNSDSYKCYFYRMLTGENESLTAKISR